MEEITRQNGVFYYGHLRCDNAGHAYSLFRSDYNRSLGKAVYQRLNRLGSRKERVHSFGIRYSGGIPANPLGDDDTNIRFIHMGLVGISYCRMTGVWWMPRIDDEDLFWRWLDWLLAYGNKHVVVTGRRSALYGRTSKKRRRKHFK